MIESWAFENCSRLEVVEFAPKCAAQVMLNAFSRTPAARGKIDVPPGVRTVGAEGL